MSEKITGRFGGHELLHTPEGVRDIYGEECRRKLCVETMLQQVFKRYGFRHIQTPMFEFFDIFNKERGTVPSRDMYKFFDRENNTLVLRPDITPSIARCAAKYFKEEEFPLRLCYLGNTFINNSSYQGKLKEVTQLGCELINDDTSDADAEMIALTIESLLETGLTDFQIDAGHADFLAGLFEEAQFDREEAEQLRALIASKNIFGVEELISAKNISADLKELFLKLPDLFGSIETVTYAQQKTKNERALNALDRLEKVYHILTVYGYSNYITFDLGMVSKYEYYTGIIFHAYTYGTGEAIATGGRYNHLVEQFGKEAPAIGLAVLVDPLMMALSRQGIEVKENAIHTMILYPQAYRKTAIRLANFYRGQGTLIELVRKSSKRDLDEYKGFAQRAKMNGIIYVEQDEEIEIIHLGKEEVQKVKVSDIIHE
jgi:ATP phosphoribosyltransferase regulatory subunit